jgi:hypothetical protein
MSKLSAKLMKAAKKGIGSIQNAWLMISKEMEAEGQAHRCIANSLEDDIVKPLKNLQETHCRIKKTVEYNVSKTSESKSFFFQRFNFFFLTVRPNRYSFIFFFF